MKHLWAISTLIMMTATTAVSAAEPAISDGENTISQETLAEPVAAATAQVDLDSKRQRARKILETMLDQGTSNVMTAAPVERQFGDELSKLAFENVYMNLWTRPGLSPRDRSMITIAMLIAMGAENELKIHVAAGLRNGLTPQELEEIIYHSSAYAGFPAASSALLAARQVVADE